MSKPFLSLGDKIHCDYILVRSYGPNNTATWKPIEAKLLGWVSGITGYFVGTRSKQTGYISPATGDSYNDQSPDPVYFVETGKRIKAALVAINTTSRHILVPYDKVMKIGIDT